MATKIRLTGEDPAAEAAQPTPAAAMLGADAATQQMLKYAEAIDWKLWEILKILRKQTEGNT
jgi:hypothetical protein